MDKDRLILGIGRLERAVSRIERGLARRAAAPPAEPADPGLADRHQALRRQVESAITRIDALVEKAQS